ncbi:hypothetical protein F5X68DRAFT_226895 [Plectosphaerella plurivora]|uniref:Uncharacterized protein n=1 Tax=Plectosphaerella plurivora TaxID=936078 RepID=A0A9P8VN63_9PEZI|nr:hypothetical protein F5X68DRAFT_226895 [Plectosphaerella plurivora]
MEYEDGASYQERVARAIQKSRPCFTDDAFYRVAAAYPIYGTSYIINSILDNQLALRTENPRSFEGFRANVGKLFDAQFLSHLEQKSKAFDVLCGKPHADALWGKMTYLQWAELIADNCIMCNMAPLPREDASQHQSNGASNPPSSSTTISAHGGAQPAPITQVNLRGATLKEAWEGSSQANLISAFEQPNNWTPSEPTDVEVFWGTSTHLKDREREEDMDKVLGTHPITLGRRPGLTQLHPHHNLCAGILTTFSAFERFLWPVFLTEVIDDPPGPSPSGKLAQSFQMRGRSYKGVLLKCDAFDDLCGSPIADGFFGQKTHLEWAELIAANTVAYFKDNHRPSVPQGQFDGPSDSPNPSAGPSSSPVSSSSPSASAAGRAPPPITQIHLSGPSIMEAWRRSSETGAISPYERMTLPPAWSPATLGGAQVFHGTSVHLRTQALASEMNEVLGTTPIRLRRSAGPTQLFPKDDRHVGIYTSFSAMRSFLWLMFNGEVIEHPPAWMSPDAARVLNGNVDRIFAISFELVSRPDEAGQPLKKRKIVDNFVRKTNDSIKKKLF